MLLNIEHKSIIGWNVPLMHEKTVITFAHLLYLFCKRFMNYLLISTSTTASAAPTSTTTTTSGRGSSSYKASQPKSKPK